MARHPPYHTPLEKKQLKPLLLALEQCATQERSVPFIYPAIGYPEVDKIAYLGFIPCPMDLGLVRRRIENDYYRTFEAVKGDLENVVATCELWHGVGSEISQSARDIVDWLLPFAAADAVSKTSTGEQLFALGSERQANASQVEEEEEEEEEVIVDGDVDDTFMTWPRVTG